MNITPNYSSFKPSNIFEKDSNNNDIFFWLFSGYIITDKKKREKLIDLMGSRYFYFSYRPPMLFLSIFISVFILSFFYDLTFVDNKSLFMVLSIPIYLFFCFIYLLRIFLTLKGCTKISKEEKYWINEKKRTLS